MTASCRRLAFAFAGLACLACLAGCSGSGAPPERPHRRPLRAAAEDHVTTVLMVRRWFAILYPEPSAAPSAATCRPRWVTVPPEPGDPPNSQRYRGTMSDCTRIEALLNEDGSGTQTFRFPNGRHKAMTWGAPSNVTRWLVYAIEETLWDGATLEYDRAVDQASPLEDQYEKGVARLADGRTLDFTHGRNLERDRLDLRPDDGSALALTVRLGSASGGPFSPAYKLGAKGTFRDPHGATQSFRVWGDRGWENWEFTTDDALKGTFVVGPQFDGSGTLWSDGRFVGTLRWTAAGDVRVEPFGANGMDGLPSAAARDFQIDQWIRNVAAMGPKPLY